MNRLSAFIFTALFLWAGLSTDARADERSATLYRNPQCMCCEAYARYMRAHGYPVTEVTDVAALEKINRQYHLPARLAGCHTTLIDGYAVSGHVPIDVVARLLKERPAVTGITLPGMAAGTPGMGGIQRAPLEILAFRNGRSQVYAVR